MAARQFAIRHADRLIAAALAAVFCAEIAGESRFAGDRVLSLVCALALCSALVWRQRAPLIALGIAVAIVELSNLAAPALGDSGAFAFALLLALYSTGRHARGRALIAGTALVVVAVPAAAIEPGDPVTFTDIAFFVLLLGGPLVTGLVIRVRRERERALEGEAERAVADERTRIARELHDVVSHAISLIVLQARGGRRLLAEDPDETRRALDVIEHAGEQALGEMRRLLGRCATATPRCRSRRSRVCGASTR